MAKLKVDDGVLLIGLRIRYEPLWVAVFFGRYAFVLIGSGDGK